MAVYPGGYNEHRSAQIRRILYISIVVIVVGVIAIAGYILLRNRGGSQEVAPEPQANTTEHGQSASPVAQTEPGVTKPAAGSASSPQASHEPRLFHSAFSNRTIPYASSPLHLFTYSPINLFTQELLLSPDPV